MTVLRENLEFLRLATEMSTKCRAARSTLEEQLQLLDISEEEATNLYLAKKELPKELSESLLFLDHYEVLVKLSDRILKGEFDEERHLTDDL